MSTKYLFCGKIQQLSLNFHYTVSKIEVNNFHVFIFSEQRNLLILVCSNYSHSTYIVDRDEFDKIKLKNAGLFIESVLLGLSLNVLY